MHDELKDIDVLYIPWIVGVELTLTVVVRIKEISVVWMTPGLVAGKDPSKLVDGDRFTVAAMDVATELVFSLTSRGK